MNKCPVCNTEAVPKQYPGTPYWVCPHCDCWFQNPKPPKVYEGEHEKLDGEPAGHLMSDHDKSVNDGIAGWLFDKCMNKTPGKTLDIGSKYPYLAHCLKNRGCDAYGMDNIEVVPEYSKELEVPMLMADFEAITDEQIKEWTKTEKFDLISMVHVFEHMYDPMEALRKLRRLLKDDGTLYLRLPQHDVSGFERDLTEGHYTIHPFYHSFSSILELLVQAKDLFTVTETRTHNGIGQRDLILKPLTRKPQVWAGLIVKNEERDLPRALKSIEPFVDGVVVVDTGSTDRTKYVAKHTIKKPVEFSVYTDASEKDETGDWKLWDFGKARNEFIRIIDEKPEADYVLWFDADDELITPVNLKRAIYWSEFEVFGVWILSGGDKWVHHRLWRNHTGIKFEGRCHEYPTYGGFAAIQLMDSYIRHHAEPGAGESSNARNLRILKKEFEEKPTPRCAFYLANTHKDAGRWEEAIPVYQARINFGPHYYDEWLFAYLYKARCERAAKKNGEAKTTLYEAISKNAAWSEFWMELAYIFYDERNWWMCIATAIAASTNRTCMPPTQLWREPNKYTDQPLRLISWAYSFLNRPQDALEWALKAKEAIGAPDKDWDERIAQLAKSQPSNVPKAKKIALHRPGAIGDIVMTLNLIPELRKTLDEETEIHYYCAPSIGQQLEQLMYEAGVDEIHDCGKINEFRGEYARVYDLIGYPLQEGYPERPMRDHLLNYFAREMGIGNPGPYSLELQKPVLPTEIPTEYATLHVKAGWSAYKNWSYDRWEEVVKQMPIPVIQLGASTDPKIPGAIHDFMGKPLQASIDLIANAKIHMGIDSFTNHITNYTWLEEGKEPRKTPAVILWGSTQFSAAGYKHNKNISLGLQCQPCFREDPAISRQPRGVCINPPGQVYEQPRHACMEGITVEQVMKAINELLN